MDKTHDLGGSLEFGAIELEPGADAPFHHEWEARVFALNRLFLKRGTYTLDEFRATIERMNPQHYLEASYYERWLSAIESLLTEKGVVR